MHEWVFLEEIQCQVLNKPMVSRVETRMWDWRRRGITQEAFVRTGLKSYMKWVWCPMVLFYEYSIDEGHVIIS